MDSHIHLLVEEDPETPPVDDAELDRRLRILYSPLDYERIIDRWECWEKEGAREAIQEEKARFRARMNNLSDFMKTLKQRFGRWYNGNYKNSGTLWEDRFRSTIVEGGGALRAVSAYIDLNPVRAGMVKDPLNYRHCGYAKAYIGDERARQNIVYILELSDIRTGSWKEAVALYRQLLYVKGEARETDEGIRAGFSKETVERVLAAGGKLSLPEALRCRLRYMTHSQVLGSREVVEEIFQQYRSFFGKNRQTGARKIRKIETEEDLFSLRDIQKDIIIPSSGLG